LYNDISEADWHLINKCTPTFTLVFTNMETYKYSIQMIRPIWIPLINNTIVCSKIKLSPTGSVSNLDHWHFYTLQIVLFWKVLNMKYHLFDIIAVLCATVANTVLWNVTQSVVHSFTNLLQPYFLQRWCNYKQWQVS